MITTRVSGDGEGALLLLLISPKLSEARLLWRCFLSGRHGDKFGCFIETRQVDTYV
jgi:hypothetical protein